MRKYNDGKGYYTNNNMRKPKVYLAIKYGLDKFFALLALIILSPLFAAIAVAIAADSRGPILFRQPREGYNREIIRVYKFRTMKTKDIVFDKHNAVIEDTNVNVTRVGKVLRKFKMDELPQLLNIIRGDMSFIGPRPLMPVYSNGYERWEFYKFSGKPGMSGLAQVNGNCYLSIPARSYYDIIYNENVSFVLDVKIFFKTLITIFVGEKRFLREPSQEQIEAVRNKYNA